MLDEVKQALTALETANKGLLRPEDVVEAARPRDSVLHPLFTWNNAAAAEQHRLNEARALIRMVRVEMVVNRVIIEVPYYVRDPTLGKTQGYRSLGRLRNDEDIARETVLAEFQRAVGALTRAKAIAAALGMGKEIEEVEVRLNALVGRASAADEARVS